MFPPIWQEVRGCVVCIWREYKSKVRRFLENKSFLAAFIYVFGRGV